LTETRAVSSNPPGWEILLSHHFVGRYNRTFCVNIGTRRVHFCARCSGQVLGILGFVVLYWACLILNVRLDTLSAQSVFVFGPLPAALDWATQTTGTRESSNGLRLSSGILLGMSVADAVSLLILGEWFFLAGAALVLTAYVVSLALFLRVSGSWRRVIEEHFPGLVAPSIR
jgi:uncharacterized membrane protein